jgi:magnesium transporter
LPLGIILTSDYIITVCIEENDILPGAAGGINNYCTWKKTRFLLQILYKTAAIYLRNINEMNRISDRLEVRLRQSMRNEELFKMMDLERGMTYFTGAIRSNRVMIDKLSRIFQNNQLSDIVKLREEDEDLLEDVKIENDQAYDMIRLYSDVIGGMMDAFASIISNNLNIVMKFLASVTIIIAVPTAVASFWGMNVPVPYSQHHFGFWIVLGFSATVASIATWWLWKRKMM